MSPSGVLIGIRTSPIRSLRKLAGGRDGQLPNAVILERARTLTLADGEMQAQEHEVVGHSHPLGSIAVSLEGDVGSARVRTQIRATAVVTLSS